MSEVKERTGCVEYSGGLTLCYGPGGYYVHKEERDDNQWCFGCRKRGGVWQFMVTDVISYTSDPYWRYRCDNCDSDRTRFGE